MHKVCSLATVIVLVGSVVALAGPAGGEHRTDVNYTVDWDTHAPGSQEATITNYASANGLDPERNMETVDYLVTIGPAALNWSCTLTDAQAAGVDRGNDDGGTETDDTMLGKLKYRITRENDAGQNVTTYQFYSESDFGGNPIHLNVEDQIIARIANCYQLPRTPGWYRSLAYINGTEADGDFGEIAAYSHWYYICECEDREAAVATLGAPPDTELFTPDQAPGRPRGPFYLAEPRPDGDVRDGETPAGGQTETPSGAATPTPTETPTATPGEAGTARRGDASTATSTAQRGRLATDGGPTATGTAAGPTDGAPSTDTSSGGGPGFTAVGGLAGSILAVLMLRWRR